MCMAIDKHNEIILIVFDLSTSFDIIEHTLIFDRLRNQYGNTLFDILNIVLRKS